MADESPDPKKDAIARRLAKRREMDKKKGGGY